MAAAQPGGGAKAPTRYEQLCDIKCHELNEDRLIRLERNDPDIDGLWITANYLNWSSRVGQAIGRSRYLRKLLLECDGQTLSQGMNPLYFLRDSHTSNIEHLELFGSNDAWLQDDEVTILCGILMNEAKLLSLELSSINLSVSGWRTLLSTVTHPKCRLEALCLSDMDIFLLVGEAVAVKGTLLHLDINHNYIERSGWRDFLLFLSETFVGLETLRLHECTLVENDIAELFEVFANNLSLREVHTTSVHGKRVWEDLLRILYNTTSISSTFTSNHAIYVFDMWAPDDDESDAVDDALKDDVMWSLEMNENENKAEVSQIKIIQAHFSGPNADVSIFTRMPETILPFAMEWIGRTRVGLPLMYLVVQDLPTLFHTCHGPHCGERKRKIDATMLQ